MLIQLKNIVKYYDTPGSDYRQMVLDGIDLQIDKGHSVAIIGPSGSGKSTLLNIMGTLDEPVSGEILFNDKNVKKLNNNELAELRNRHIGFVFQKHLLLPQLSVIENVLLPTLAIKNKSATNNQLERGRELLERLGLSDKLNQFPGKLSVGECQRAAVARALINQPQIILADEPTGSLDKAHAENLGDLLKSVYQDFGVALVVVTHSQSLAKRMNRIFSIENGKLMAN